MSLKFLRSVKIHSGFFIFAIESFNKHMKELPSEEFDLGKRIRTIREIKGYRQNQVAKMLGMTVSGYSRIERNEVSVTVDKLVQFCKIVQVSVDDVINLPDLMLIHNVSRKSSVSTEKDIIAIDKIEKSYKQQIDILKEEVKYLRKILSDKIKVADSILNKFPKVKSSKRDK